MQGNKSLWVKKTLGACLAFSMFTLPIVLALTPSSGQAHAEHGTEGGVPTVSPKARLPKGISLQVVKTNAYQFALATDGAQTVEVLGEDRRAFIRVDHDRLYADLNANGWHRSRQPGGGPIPERLKTKSATKPNWVLLDRQSGYGWYDPRLMNEELAHFNLTLRINGKPLSVRIERTEPEPMTGYWRPILTKEPALDGLNAMVPGLSGNAFLLSRMPSAELEFQVLDDNNKPFIEIRQDGVWLDSTHPWAHKTGLFFTPGDAQSRWVKVSETGTVTYSDPRLARTPGNTSEVGLWRIPVQGKGSSKVDELHGDLRWQMIDAVK